MPALHALVDHWFIPAPSESHHTFGTGFIVVGALMTAEGLSGSVWSRSQWRNMLLPATLVTLGWGMLAVTFVDPEARLVHFAMGLPLIIGGWAEAQYRNGRLSRAFADAFIVPALLVAAFDVAAFHVDMPITGGSSLSHAALAVTAVAVAGARLYESQRPSSLARHSLVSGLVLLIGLELYLDALFL